MLSGFAVSPLTSQVLALDVQDAGEEALAPITDNQQLLEAIIAPLSGKASPAADDDTTREALAEAVLLLVGAHA
jgi:hypothetical protein